MVYLVVRVNPSSSVTVVTVTIVTVTISTLVTKNNDS